YAEHEERAAAPEQRSWTKIKQPIFLITCSKRPTHSMKRGPPRTSFQTRTPPRLANSPASSIPSCCRKCSSDFPTCFRLTSFPQSAARCDGKRFRFRRRYRKLI